jgi:tetratricopeptide (TPR) repeat protein
LQDYTSRNSIQLSKKHEIIKFYTEKLYTSKEKLEVANYLHLRGCVYFDSFEYDFCEHDFVESLKYNEENALLYFDFSDLCVIQKRFKEGIYFGEKSISLNPNFPLGLFYFVDFQFI